MDISGLFLDAQRQLADREADNLVKQIFEAQSQSKLYAVFRLNTTQIETIDYEPLQLFLNQQKEKPQWFNSEQILAGQQFFKKYATPIMTLLGGLSLPYCYAATPGNKALYFSEKMRQSPAKRLAETADFIIDVSTPYQLDASQEGHLQINKIRLIHAIARYYILSSGKWRLEWGQPINQEDMAGTNLAFSYIILKGLTKIGYRISQQEQEDFLALWRYIGYQMNIDEQLLAVTMKEAGDLERAIRRRHFKPSEEGQVLTKELMTYYKSITEGAQSSLMDAQVRYWLGSYVADIIGMPKHPIKDPLVQTINKIKDSVSFLMVDPKSFETMLANQKILKQKFNLN